MTTINAHYNQYGNYLPLEAEIIGQLAIVRGEEIRRTLGHTGGVGDDGAIIFIANRGTVITGFSDFKVCRQFVVKVDSELDFENLSQEDKDYIVNLYQHPAHVYLNLRLADEAGRANS